MATANDIAQVRDFVAEPDDVNGWTDVRIALYIDGSSNSRLAASDIWMVKAAASATLVNVSESGSSRSLSDIYKNAREMADRFRSEGLALLAVPSRPVIRPIRRP